MGPTIHIPRKPGRPTKLEAEVAKRLAAALEAGNYRRDACVYAGIRYETFMDWLHRGATGEEPYAKFRQEIDEAESKAVVRMVAQWQRLMPEDWKAIATFLERRRPEEWGRRITEITGKDGGPIVIIPRLGESLPVPQQVRLSDGKGEEP